MSRVPHLTSIPFEPLPFRFPIPYLVSSTLAYRQVVRGGEPGGIGPWKLASLAWNILLKAILTTTGTYDQIKQTCKSYRVYFSTPPEIKPGQDYLVDHSIYFYLMGTSFLSLTLFLTPPRRMSFLLE